MAYWFALVAMQYILPGKTVEGVVLTNGKRLKYKLNGTFMSFRRDAQLANWPGGIAFGSFMLVITYCGTMTYKEGFNWWVWAFIYDNLVQLITGALVFSIATAFYCYISSFFTGEILANNSGNVLYDVSDLHPSAKQPEMRANSSPVVHRPSSQPACPLP